jgi:lysozyme
MLDILTILIKRFEGLAKVKKDGLVHPYICPAGYATQGYGLLVKDMTVPPITLQVAEARLQQVLPKYLAETFRTCPNLHKATPAQQAAIVDFCFNLGAHRLAGSRLKRRVDEGNWEAAQVELRKWVYGGGKILPGLVLRREAEAQLLLK